MFLYFRFIKRKVIRLLNECREYVGIKQKNSREYGSFSSANFPMAIGINSKVLFNNTTILIAVWMGLET